MNKWISFILSTIGCPIVWDILDFLYNTLITKEAFQFKLIGNLILPLIVGAVLGYFSFIRKKDK